MSEIIDVYIKKLCIIEQLHEYHKLNTIDTFEIYKPSPIAWVQRKWYRDSKEQTMSTLTDLFTNINTTVSCLRYSCIEPSSMDTPNRFTSNEDIPNGAWELDHVRYDNSKQIKNEKLVTLATCLVGSLAGLANLSKTYFMCPTTTGRITSIVRTGLVPSYRILLDHLHKVGANNNLPTRLTFNGELVFESYTCGQPKTIYTVAGRHAIVQNISL